MENKKKLMNLFARVNKIVGVLGSLGVHVPVEGIHIKIVETVTTDHEYEQRTLHTVVWRRRNPCRDRGYSKRDMCWCLGMVRRVVP